MYKLCIRLYWYIFERGIYVVGSWINPYIAKIWNNQLYNEELIKSEYWTRKDSYIFTRQLYIYKTAIYLQDSYIFTGQLYIYRTTIYLHDNYIFTGQLHLYIFTGQLYIYRTAIYLQDSYMFTGQLYIYKTACRHRG